MKEIRLFEVGFKEKPDSSGHYEKFYVGAVGALPAVKLARAHLVQKTMDWWEAGGEEDTIFNLYVEDNSAPDDVSDKDVLATEKYQDGAKRVFKKELERTKGLYLSRVHDVGELVI